MSLKTYLQRLHYIDSLICKKATGNQKTLAVKLRLSRSGLNKLLSEMRDVGFPIRYDTQRQTYYYENEGRMVDALFKERESMSIDEMKQTRGGYAYGIYFLQTV